MSFDILATIGLAVVTSIITLFFWYLRSMVDEKITQVSKTLTGEYMNYVSQEFVRKQIYEREVASLNDRIRSVEDKVDRISEKLDANLGGMNSKLDLIVKLTTKDEE